MEKFTFGMSHVQYMAYIIDEKGMHVDPAKIWDWPSLTTLIELHIFLGLANFYQRFVLGFSHINWPLSQVTKGEAKGKFFWYESQEKVFFEMKNHLYSTPVLTFPNQEQPFEIETNALDYTIGVVLTQQRAFSGISQ